MRKLVVCLAASLLLAEPKTQTPVHIESVDAGDGLELLTVFTRDQVPILCVLRDQLGSAATGRLRNVWVLTYARPSTGQRIAAALPFFYSRVGSEKPRGDRVPV